jgi:hypothetical protein
MEELEAERAGCIRDTEAGADAPKKFLEIDGFDATGKGGGEAQ